MTDVPDYRWDPDETIAPPPIPGFLRREIHDGSYYDLPRDCQLLDDVIVRWNNGEGMSWHQANIFKATYRWHKKGLEYNLLKVQWFCERALAIIYEERKNALLQVSKNEDCWGRD